MKIRLWTAVILFLFCATSSVHAQWLKHPTPGIPRTPDGAPNLAAPAPRTAEGKPDFSGVWGFDAGPSLFYIAGGLKPDEVSPPVFEALKQSAETPGREDFPGCHPEGPRFNHFLAFSKKIVQTPTVMIVLSEDLTY